MTRAFSDRLIDAFRARGVPACVGLDPVLERLPDVAQGDTPAERLRSFGLRVIDATAGILPAIKFQSACFERYGSAGIATLHHLARAASDAEMVTILDAKRGDIGISAEHYAAAAWDANFDAMTVSPYLGPDTLAAFLRPGRGLFVLVRTSNPGSDAVQSARLADGRTVAQLIADQVADIGARTIGALGYSDVGAVVGATKSTDAAALRERLPRQIFLVPGFGAQGGTASDVRAMLDGRTDCGGGVLVTASRSVIFPESSSPWASAVRSAALRLADQVRSAIGA
ncbi:MAG: orotidine-5'-phosphate decarboxylase [Phycisphaerae bacterium]|nr:orotidine-5'-phosphate decarboxylase [Phycisphaerae bacterium]